MYLMLQSKIETFTSTPLTNDCSNQGLSKVVKAPTGRHLDNQLVVYVHNFEATHWNAQLLLHHYSLRIRRVEVSLQGCTLDIIGLVKTSRIGP